MGDVKLYGVSVEGFGEHLYYAQSPGKARAQAFSSYQRAYERATFKAFLKISRVRRCPYDHPDPDGYSDLRRRYPDAHIPAPGSPVEAEGHSGTVIAALEPTSYVAFFSPELGRIARVHPSSVEPAHD